MPARISTSPSSRLSPGDEATGEQKALWWSRALEVWPAYDAYQAGTDRVIPLFVLQPVDEA